MSWIHLRDDHPKARKDHLCYLCELPIPKGTTYVSRSGIDDDGPVTCKMHAACEAHTKKWKEEEWECHDPYEFREWLSRHNAQGHPARSK